MDGSLSEIQQGALRRWAETESNVISLWIFGSYAKGCVKSSSDLDIAFEFTNTDEPDTELICNAQRWKNELSNITGVVVKDLYHRSAQPVQDPVLILHKCECSGYQFRTVP